MSAEFDKIAKRIKALRKQVVIEKAEGAILNEATNKSAHNVRNLSGQICAAELEVLKLVGADLNRYG